MQKYYQPQTSSQFRTNRRKRKAFRIFLADLPWKKPTKAESATGLWIVGVSSTGLSCSDRCCSHLLREKRGYGAGLRTRSDIFSQPRGLTGSPTHPHFHTKEAGRGVRSFLNSENPGEKTLVSGENLVSRVAHSVVWQIIFLVESL